MRALKALTLLALFLLPNAALAAIYACEPADAFLVEHRRTPCDEGDDGERIETVTPESVEGPHSTVLTRADSYYRNHVLGGQTLTLGEWHTQEALASPGLRDALPGSFARSQEHAEKHGGIAAIEFEITGALENLVAANVFVEFNDGRIDKQTSCWKREGDTWKSHSSCLEIALRAEDLSEKDEEALRALQSLVEGEP